jgi:hypothetical protein
MGRDTECPLPPQTSSTCELIAISRGYAKEMEYWDTTPLPPRGYHWREESKGVRYEFYNVLWIEWEDGIAYRKGIGHVEKYV